MIQLRNIERTYKTGAGVTYVLRRINLEIREGEFVTVMGPSGSGKSTLMSIIGMLDDSWTGEYYLFEHAVHKLDRKKRSEVNRKYIGFVFQSYHLLDNLTVYENLDVPLSYRNVSPGSRPASWLRYSIAFKL
jgi:putative ABC transport system ATP-binding protein